MAVLVTRPHPDDEATAAACAPGVLRCCWRRCCGSSRSPSTTTRDARYGAVIVTSANALRGIEPHLKGHRLLELPLFAVGEHTASAARRAGFANVIPANGDAASLRDLVLASVKGEGAEESRARCSISPAPISRAIWPANSANAAFTVVTQTTYRMVAGGRACRAKPATLSPPAGSRRCCIIRGAARAHSWRRRGPPASKYRHWRSRNAASPTALPRSSATPGPPRSWWRPRRMKMPCSGRWTVLCGPVSR